MDSDSNEMAFLRVAECSSFARAAEQLNLSASALSKKVAKLESRLGVRLLRRSTRSMVLTPQGERYFVRIKAVFEQVAEIETEVTKQIDSPTGALRVSCFAAFAEIVLVPLLPEFFSSFPNISVELITADRVDIVSTAVDVQILSFVPSQQIGRCFQVLENPQVVCAAREYLDNSPALNNPADLDRHNCLILNGRSTREDGWLFRSDVHPASPLMTQRVRGNFGGFGLAVKKAAVLALGVARLPSFMVREDLRDGRLVSVLSDFAPDLHRAVYASVPDDRQIMPKHEAFIAFLQQKLRHQPPLLSINWSSLKPPADPAH